MKPNYSLILVAGVATILGACASTPKSIDELETARAVVAQVESSPRAGVAAQNIAEARQSLDRADKLASNRGDLADITYEAQIASKHAQIANEKILTAMAQDEVQKGEAQRQQVLLEAREREVKQRAMQADAARSDADAARKHASSLEDELKSLKAKQTERGLVLTLGDVLFDTGEATLKSGAYMTIDRLSQALKDSPDRTVLIEGHTDSVGADEFNQQLSERRAMAVQSALMQRGVSGNQISAMGKGETFPVASNDNAGGRQQNRRVEMIFANEPSRTASDGGG